MIGTVYIFNEIYDILLKTPVQTLAIEIGLIILFATFITYQRNRPGKKLTAQQRSAILEEWTPEPLVPDTPIDHPVLTPKIITGRIGKRITVNGGDCLNLASHNYLGLLDDPEIEEAAITSLRKYGVGSCGPRGFYGTLDVHLELEERIAKFMEMEEAAIYSYGFSTIASAIPSYCKRGDLVFVDEMVNFAIQKGLEASRSKIFYFKHNDAGDLERLLEQQDAWDRKNVKKAGRLRRFLIAEAIYMNTGEMCPLRQLVELRKKYKLRMILDEGVSFGTVGKNGRGLTELLGIDRKEIDLISSSLELAVGSIGGFCVGTTYIVDHQRLSGLGYCFSASAPPLLTQAAISALDRFEREPEMFSQLSDRSEKLHDSLNQLKHFKLGGHRISPVKHLYLKEHLTDYDEEYKLLREISEICIKKQLAIVVAEYLDDRETVRLRPSIRITSNRMLTDMDIHFVFDTLESVSDEIFLIK